MQLVWKYFNELANARTSNGYGPNPISYTEINAWNDLMQSYVSPFEVEIIKRLDITYLNHYATKQKKDK
jgi:hypothetical protein